MTPGHDVDWRQEIRRRLRVDVDPEREAEIVEELAQDLEQRFEALCLRGVSGADARRQLIESLEDGARLSRNLQRVEPAGDPVHASPAARNPIPGLLQDLRLAVRLLVRNPGFALVSVLTLAFGLGANLAMFNIVYTALWRPLPFADPGALVHVHETRPNGGPTTSTSILNFGDWRASSQSFAEMAVYTDTGAILTGAGDPLRLDAIAISSLLLPLLGAEPMLGRNFLPDEDRRHAPGTVILSQPLWERRFGADAAVIGRSLTIDGQPHTIVGVMPRDFQFPVRDLAIDLWLPIHRDGFAQMQLRDGRLVEAVARLKPGVSIEQAQAEMSGIAERLARAYPATNAGFGARVVSLHDDWFGGSTRPLVLLLAAVGLVLLIACGNLASLLLARTAGRLREFAVRRALGASRARLVQLIVVQSLVIAAAGGALGVLAGLWLRGVVTSLAPASLPRLAGAALDLPAVAATFTAVIIASVIVGIPPAWLAARAGGLTSERGAGGGARHNRFLRGVLVAEIALSLVLLAGAALFARSLVRLMAVNPGFDPANVLAVPIDLSDTAYPAAAEQAGLFTAVLERVEQLPGVESVAAAFPVPFGGPVAFPFSIDGAPANARRTGAYYRAVSPDYFATLRIPLRRGRLLARDDRAGAAQVVVINESMVAQYFSDGPAIGRRITVVDRNAGDARTSREIVGIVGNVRHLGLDRPSGPEMYVPFQQAPSLWMTLLIRAPDAGTLGAGIVQEVHAVDPALPVQGVHYLDDRIARSTAQRRFNAQLLSGFAVSAILLALLGIAGTTAYIVAQRTPEIAVRIAIGATFADVMRLVLGGTLRVAILGVALGLAASLALGRAVSGLLYGIDANDPATLGAAAISMIALALIGCLVPAKRAASIDPVRTMRSE